jgi:hypothetical protein
MNKNPTKPFLEMTSFLDKMTLPVRDFVANHRLKGFDLDHF